MRVRCRALLPWLLGSALLIGLGAGSAAWLAENPFADGFQNEYLHVGNAFDLWDAARTGDGWHLGYYVSHAYWPPLFYAAPWPLLALWERSREALVAANLGWLALALAASWGLAQSRTAGLTAMLLFALAPGTFGTLVRYEPAIAQAACLGWALLALRRSEGFRRPGWSLGGGLALALGLLTDRLGTAPFLVLPLLLALLPAALPVAPGERLRIPPASTAALPTPPRWRLPWRGLLAFALPVLLLAGPWYLQWAIGQAAEVQSQLMVGEIDSAGAHTEEPAVLGPRWAYYPLALLDGQAGPLLGAWMLLALALALLRRRACLRAPQRPGAEGLALAAVLGGWLLFSVIQKKQVFYTLPLVLPLAVMGGNLLGRLGPLRAPLLLLLLGAGLHQYGWRLWGGGADLLRTLGMADPLPLAWVFPRHVLARPPSRLPFPGPALEAALGAPQRQLVLFSDLPSYYEGFVALRLREILPGVGVHGLRGDPVGSYEWFRVADAFLVLAEDGGWPSEARMEQALRDDHYDPSALPPVVEMIAQGAPAWERTAALPLAGGASLGVWKRTGAR